MAEVNKSFEFKQCISVLKATGKKAKNLYELRDGIAVVSDGSIFHHTYQYFLKGHILEYTNDFAQWAAESLEESALAEHLSNIDPYNFKNINELRKELLSVIDSYIEKFPFPREARAGDEFFFNETVTLIFPINLRAKNLAEFLLAIKYIEDEALYYHFYEARVRLGVDDFSLWIENTLGNKMLAKEIREIDPYIHNMQGIRSKIIAAIERCLKSEMEII